MTRGRVVGSIGFMVFKWIKPSDDPEIAKRIPPGQVLTDKFPVLNFGRTPDYPDLAGWTFRVWGEVETPFSLSWGEFRQLPVASVTLDIHCVTRWSKLDTAWEGVPFSHIVEVAEPTPAARHVIFHAEAGYTANVPLGVALHPDCLLAWSYDGRPLEPDHGYPLRAIVPGRYFWKSAKWLRGIEFSPEDQPGFWERNGYSNSADPWREERYADR
ncbi:MAG TPA: sulfite oxidase-like oxidoreductase [Candidatus Limnocylindria bacterium]|nr:sulfite oxidase-like oxidoreductase [Candidatus Limnocylindria bacterium]